MKQATILTATTLLALSVLVAAFINFDFVNKNTDTNNQAPFHVGVSFCGNTTAEAKLLIDRVKNYTNLLVIQSGPVSKNETSLTKLRTTQPARIGHHSCFSAGLIRTDPGNCPGLIC